MEKIYELWLDFDEWKMMQMVYIIVIIISDSFWFSL